MGKLAVKFLSTLLTPISLFQRIIAPGAVLDFYIVPGFSAAH